MSDKGLKPKIVKRVDFGHKSVKMSTDEFALRQWRTLCALVKLMEQQYGFRYNETK